MKCLLRRTLSQALGCLLVLSFPVALSAEPLTLPLFEGASVSQQNVLKPATYRVITSTPKRINNEMRIEKYARFQARGVEKIQRLRNATPIAEAFQFYKTYLSLNGEVKYACEQRNCGSSNFWANDEFNQRGLYGRDSDQYYLAGVIDQGARKHWVQIYVVQNGRRDHFVYSRVFITEDPIQQANWQSGVVIDQALGDKHAELVAALQAAMLAAPEQTLWLVAARDFRADESLESAREKVQTLAERVRDHVVEKTAIPAARIVIDNRGNLSQKPVDANASQWIVLYLR